MLWTMTDLSVVDHGPDGSKPALLRPDGDEPIGSY